MSRSHSVERYDDGPQKAVSDHQAPSDRGADRAVPNDLFDRLFGIAKQLTLPRNSWAVHCVDRDGVRDIVFSQVLVKHVPKITALHLPKTLIAGKDEITTVYCPKTVVVKSDASVTVSLVGVPVKAIAGVCAQVASGADLERLLSAVDALRVCRGGPNQKVYPGAKPERAYLDSLDAWRHVCCPLVLTKPGELCRFCRSLEATVRLNMERNARRREVGFERIRIPSRAAGEDVALLRKEKYALQKSNKRLVERIAAVRKELDDMRQEIKLVEEVTRRQQAEDA